MKELFNLSKKQKRIILIGIVVAALIYPAYQIINHYASDRTSHATLTLFKTETNIAIKADAYYNMNFGEGNLQMSNNLDEHLPDGCLSSIIGLETINGNIVQDVNLKIYYDDTLYDGNEFNIALVKIENDKFSECDFKIDAVENCISASVIGNGKWCLIDTKETDNK